MHYKVANLILTQPFVTSTKTTNLRNHCKKIIFFSSKFGTFTRDILKIIETNDGNRTSISQGFKKLGRYVVFAKYETEQTSQNHDVITCSVFIYLGLDTFCFSMIHTNSCKTRKKKLRILKLVDLP